MNTQTQGLVGILIAALLVRISITDEYLTFVQTWMRWPLLVTGAIVFVMALRPALGLVENADRMPRTTWLLVLPALVMFTVAPPPLGAYVAERRADVAPEDLPEPDLDHRVAADGTLQLGVSDFLWGAAQSDDPLELADNSVELEGFVSTGPDGQWYLTSLAMFCCAADVAVERVLVADGTPPPPRDQWIRVKGSLVEGTGTAADNPARLEIEELTEIAAPGDPYA